MNEKFERVIQSLAPFYVREVIDTSFASEIAGICHEDFLASCRTLVDLGYLISVDGEAGDGSIIEAFAVTAKGFEIWKAQWTVSYFDEGGVRSSQAAMLDELREINSSLLLVSEVLNKLVDVVQRN